MTPLVLKLLIEGSSAGALKALGQVRTETNATSAALGKLDQAGGMSKTRAELQAVSAQMTQVKTLAGQVFAFAGVSLGIGALVQLADEYKNMQGRLQLVTQYTGNFAEVQGLLQQSARDTRSDLAATVDLYVKMAPALQGLGYNAAQSAGMITTINQAIGLSGASSQAAAAALMQLGQGFGSGQLRGEELNSILEQTPALAMAIADGLGVPIGELRKLGEEGKLTAETVAGALEKVAPQLEEDFKKMPKTVGQAMTALRNEILTFVGATDTAAGGTTALAAVIENVAAGFRDGSPAITAFSEGLKLLIESADLAYRILKVTGLAIGAVAAGLGALASGNFSGIGEIFKGLKEDIAGVWNAPKITEGAKAIEATAEATAKKRASLEEQLKVQFEKLEKAKAYVAGESLDAIAKKEKETIDKRIADQQRLVDAVRAAWQASLAEAEKATAAADAKRQKAGDYRQRAQDAAFNAGLKGLTPEQQAAAQAQRLQDLAGQGNYESARARVAAMEGDAKKFEATAAVAEKKLLAALELAEKVGDATAAEDIGKELARLQEAGAGLEDKKAAAAKAQAEAQAATLNQLQAQLEALQKTARELEVKANVDDANQKIKGLEAQLAALKDKTVTVTVNTVNTGGSLSQEQLDALPTGGDFTPLPARAFGGPLPGFASHDRADNMIYRGTPGEWVIQRPAVRYWGPAFMAAINAMRLPKFAFGGQLGASSAVSNLRVPSISASRAMGSGDPAIFDLGALGRIRAQATGATAGDVEAVIKRAALRFGRR